MSETTDNGIYKETNLSTVRWNKLKQWLKSAKHDVLLVREIQAEMTFLEEDDELMKEDEDDT